MSELRPRGGGGLQEAVSRRGLLRGAAAWAAAGAPLPAADAGAARQEAGAAPFDPQRPGRTRRTRFAVNVEMWWRRLPFLERLQQAAALGFPAVEMWPWRGKDIDAVADQARRLGLEIAQFTAWGFSPGLNDPKNHSRFVDEVGASCEIAKKLEVKRMTVVGGDDQPGMAQAEMHQNIIDGLKLGAPVAESHGVTLILEPMNIRVDHKGHCLYGSTPAIHICRAVGSPSVRINWDLYHMHITEGDLCGHLREGIDWIGYVQLSDHPGRHEPGTGEIHYPRVLKELHTLGYRDFVGLECSPSGSEIDAARACAHADEW